MIIDSEEAARGWLQSALDPTPKQWQRLEQFAALLVAANATQNLVAQSTEPTLWVRHIADSAQLLRFAPPHSDDARWFDLGSGAGLPGLVVAILSDWPCVLVESRRRRCDFLRATIEALDMEKQVELYPHRLETLTSDRESSQATAHGLAARAEVISARAFAPLARLLDLSAALSTEKTRWLLPKGKNAHKELASLPIVWQRLFHMKHSLTDRDSRILVGDGAARERPKRCR